jgi:hypothetical protein
LLLLQVLLLGISILALLFMTPHSTHLCTLSPYRHCTVHTVDGFPLSVTGQGTLYSDFFHVPDVSFVPDLTMQLMSVGQIIDHDFRVILDPNFCYVQDHRTDHLVGTDPVVVIHNVFGSLTGFVFLPLRPPVLSALLMLSHPYHRLLSGIIVWVTFVAPACWLYFIEVF